MQVLQLVIFVNLINLCWCQFARPDQAPVQLEITPEGKPILGFSRTNCNSAGERIHYGGQNFFRDSCPSRDTWVRGIDPQQDPEATLALTCGFSPLLRLASRYATVILRPGDTFRGGNFVQTGTGRVGVDVIIDIQKSKDPIGRPVFRLEVARIYCDGSGEDAVMMQNNLVPPPVFFPAAATCFHGDNNVTTHSGLKLIKDLKLGDLVLTSSRKGELEYTPVTSFMHHLPNIITTFLIVETEENHSITLTPSHLIYAVECADIRKSLASKVFAKDLRAQRDCLMKIEEGDRHIFVKIKHIENRTMTGAYGPLTTNSDIVVNSLAASCHAIIDDASLVLGVIRFSRTIERVYSYVTSFLGYSATNATVLNIPSTVEYLIEIAHHLMPSLL